MTTASRGFTLIELMVVVAILAIIASFAFSSYTSQVQQTRRAAVQTEMLEIAQNLERCEVRTNAYNGCAIVGRNSEDGRYEIELELTADDFTINATPTEGGSQADDECGEMTLNRLGVKTGAQDDCWQ